MINYYKRAVVFQVPGMLKFEFLYGNRILKLIVTRERPTDGALATLDVKEEQITIVFDFQDVFSKEYDLLSKRSVELSIILIS